MFTRHMSPAVLVIFLCCLSPLLAAASQEIYCSGTYDGHLQGVTVDAAGNIYWCFTVALVKTDATGKLLKQVDVPTHHGDLWVEKDTVYVAVNHRAPGGNFAQRQSWIYAYKVEDLSLQWKREIPEVRQGVGGLTMRDGHFFVASGRLLKSCDENIIYEYDGDATFIKQHALKSGSTYLGIQTIAYADGAWWFGCYGKPPEALRADAHLTFKERFDYDCSMGISPLPQGGFYIGRCKQNTERKNVGWVIKTDQPKAESISE